MTAVSSDILLAISSLRVAYDGIRVVHGVDLEVRRGEIMAVLGANGSGKSTLFNAISGIKRPVEGSIAFEGRPIETLPAHATVALGISHVLERQRSFPYLSVFDNLMLGGHLLERRERRRRAEASLDIFPALRRLSGRLAKDLSGGEQQMLAIARGLMMRPRLLILDEPFMGLTPAMVSEVLAVMKRQREEGVSVMFCEHRILQAVEISDRVIVMANGQIALAGDGSELSDTDRIREIYLGKAADARKRQAV